MVCKQRILAAFNVLVVFVVTLVVLLIVHAWIYSELTYTPLPFAEPWLYHLITVGMLALASTASAMLTPGWRGIFYSMLAPLVVYLGWAVVQQNLIVNPDIWKLWERGWLTVALAAGFGGLTLSIAVRSARLYLKFK